ncbi:hypothetical protein ACERII_05225 [Evansella sp. AB-rgal1]|uniref:hypothetical protein n=1 Tax=Evansella sp. AB-rgal1 TaxID=3242696 RepID=UPI00359DAC36
MNQTKRPFSLFLILATFVLSTNVITYGLTLIIDMTVQISSSMYSVGYDVGTYLREIFITTEK